MNPSRRRVAEALESVASGDRTAVDRLATLVYDDLRALAAAYLKQEARGHTLQPTALVHEAFMRLTDQTRVEWKGKSHFFAIAAQAMRRILVDHARAKMADKRGGGWIRVSSEKLELSSSRDEDVIALDDALRTLERLDPLQAKILELRFFGGLSVREVAEALGRSKRKVEADWTIVRAWLRSRLSVQESRVGGARGSMP